MSTFLQTYDRFLAFKQKRIKPNSFKGYKTLRTHIENSGDLAEMPFQQVRLINLQSFIDGLNLKESTLQNLKIYLSQFYKWSSKYGYGGNVNISDIELPYQPKTRNDRNLQIIDPMQLAKSKYAWELLLAYFTGMREGEILGLKYIDIDLDNMSISISRTWTRFGVQDTPKTVDSIRTIPLPQQLLPYLKARGEKNQSIKSDYISINPNTGKIISPVTLDNAIKKIYPNISMHYLRHDFITRGVESGVSIEALKRLVGHSKSSNTIYKIYTHLGQDFINREYDKIKF